MTAVKLFPAPLALALTLLAVPVSAQSWGALATISETMGVSGSRICIGEASRGDIGCPSFAPTISNTGTLNAAAGIAANSVSLTTAGVTWGYLASTVSYIPNLTSNLISTTNISVSTINGVNASSLGSSRNISFQQFTSSGTWTKPAGLTSESIVEVELWGGGGGGGSSSPGGGGGGGAWNKKTFRADDLDATVAVTVGSGGAVNTAGGTSSFGTLLYAYGGGRGNGGLAPTGGGGGGITSAGGNAGTNTDGGGGLPVIGPDDIRYGGTTSNTTPGHSLFGGGGGSGGATTSSAGSAGNSVYGGGGGGSSVSGKTAGGTSIFGGNGGANGVAGQVPGGGGGRNAAGGSGLVNVRVIP